MSAGLGECGCCDDAKQQRWSMAFHQWWGDQVTGAPNSKTHYLRRVFTYTYHVEFRHNGVTLYSWDWVDRGQIDQSKWTGENTITDFALISGTRAPAYLLSTLRYAADNPTEFGPSFDYPPDNYDASTGSTANNWYTIQAWWAANPSMDCFFFSGLPYGPFPGDYRQLGLDTIADSQFSSLGLSTANIGEYEWNIRLKTDLSYDINQYYLKQDFLNDLADLASLVNFADIKTKTENQGSLGAYHFYYSAFFFNGDGDIVERNYYALAAINPTLAWWVNQSPAANYYTEKVGGGAMSSLKSNMPSVLTGSGVGGGTLHDFYSAINCVLDVGGPSVTLSPKLDGSEGLMEFHSYFGGIYLISIFPIPSTVSSFCLSRYASNPNATTNNANADQYGSIRNGALWSDGVELLESHVTFPNPGASNIENQCATGWTHEILTQGACE